MIQARHQGSQMASGSHEADTAMHPVSAPVQRYGREVSSLHCQLLGGLSGLCCGCPSQSSVTTSQSVTPIRAEPCKGAQPRWETTVLESEAGGHTSHQRGCATRCSPGTLAMISWMHVDPHNMHVEPRTGQDRSRRPLSNQFLFPTLGRSSRQIGAGRDWLRGNFGIYINLGYSVTTSR